MESLMIILLYLILECSGQDCQSKLGSCVITPDSSRACVGYKEKVSESTNYIGIMWDLNVDLELDAEEACAECYCNSAFGTSLATILDEDDQTEMEQLLDIQYSRRRDGFWPGKTARVWVGWSNDDIDNGNSAWKPCLPSQCANGDTCSANNAKSASWHFSLDGDDELFYRRRCGTMYLATQADTGKWDAVTCYGKKDFVCNHPDGKYGSPMSCTVPTDQPTNHPTDNPTTKQPTGSPTDNPTTKQPTDSPTDNPTDSPITESPTPQPTPVPVPPPTPIPPPTPCRSDLALDIGFLMDESGSIEEDEYIVMKNFIKRLIEYDINLISYVSLFSYSYKTNFEQWTTFTLEKDQTIARLDARVSQEGSNTHTGDAITKTLALFKQYNEQYINRRPDLLFVLTDGEAFDDVCPKLKNIVIEGGVEIILIGIGNGLDIKVLQGAEYNCLVVDITKDVFYFYDFDSDEFNKREAEIRERTCRNIVPTPQPTPTLTYVFGFTTCGTTNGWSRNPLTIDWFWGYKHWRCVITPLTISTVWLCHSDNAEMCSDSSQLTYAVQFSNPSGDHVCVDSIQYPTDTSGNYATANVNEELVGDDGYYYRYYNLVSPSAVPSPVYGSKSSSIVCNSNGNQNSLRELPKVNIDGYNFNLIYVVLISTLANIFIFFITYQLCIKPQFKTHLHALDKITTDEEEALNA